MGRLPDIDRSAKIKIRYLHPHHRSMARALVAGGLQPMDLCKLYHFSPSQVSIIINSPLFKAEMARLEAMADEEAADVREQLNTLQNRAVEVLAEDINMAKGSDRRTKTALEVLDRTGYPKGAPVQKHAHLHAHLHDEIKRMNQRELYEEVMNMVEEDGGED